MKNIKQKREMKKSGKSEENGKGGKSKRKRI